MTAGRSVVIHGHFYQPPREDPWLGEVEVEPTAAPFHDWNERIDHESYRAVAAARIPGEGGRIARIRNALTGISYDVGPTLLTWLEREAPGSHAAFIEADRESRARLGFGNAIGMPYHHVILPLCTRRDKVTEVRWGMRDFERRFGRTPEGMWLPEAAVDEETLDVLAAEGVRFTVLGPPQVRQVPGGGLPGRYHTRSGRALAIFVYDGGISHDVAFGPLIRDADQWAARMVPAGSRPPRLVSMATDGETWGHHHKFGEMALAAVLERLGRTAGVRLENFTSFLARNPPQEDIDIVSPSSWSCPHGVGRWKSDCGCRIAPQLPSQQQWRAPLREALDWLSAELGPLYELEGAPSLGDPWDARDNHGAAADATAERHLPTRARELLELQRNSLAMFTSCGWFFDDVGGVETVVVLRHAARAIELAGSEAPRLKAGLLERLAPAKSNDPQAGDAARLFQARVEAQVPAARRAATGFAAARLVAPERDLQLPGYELRGRDGGVEVVDRRTGRSEIIAVVAERPSISRVVIPLPLEELPERHRLAVKHALTRAVVERWFPAESVADVLSGARDVRAAALETLGDAAGNLVHDSQETAVGRVGELLDLAELLGVPGGGHDAQTRFYEVWSCAEGELRERLSPLAARFGFVVA